jgi:hypothetical protein
METAFIVGFLTGRNLPMKEIKTWFLAEMIGNQR